jgi:hypothetical protein
MTQQCLTTPTAAEPDQEAATAPARPAGAGTGRLRGLWNAVVGGGQPGPSTDHGGHHG